ncbi:glycosyl hydrolase [uncultured Chitinophaga sp.]|uniref:glycosyl hydrolase n=1 Tax=uncultured Chitinophaga sp. TaxID=339340 RepID=UPI0025DC6B2D|nr:glycosyl hydrolase [uncultured Chitinophaga sp.]
MNVVVKKYCCYIIFTLLSLPVAMAQRVTSAEDEVFKHPPAEARPATLWYWMHGAVSKAGIKADLEAMKQAGLGAAYLVSIKDTSSNIPFIPAVRQLTPEWWEMVRYAMQEADRLGLQLAMHLSDGFALAGGPWITPELSMQKLVWTKKHIPDGEKGLIQLEQPETREGYYKDIAVFAYPAAAPATNELPVVTVSNGASANFLAVEGNKQSFRSDTVCWIQYQYKTSFTARSICIQTGSNNYQAQRLLVQVSNDGINFSTVTRLQPARHGWQDNVADYTFAIPTTTARYFRFIYDPEGSEPGAEDLDAAKWKPSLKVTGIHLLPESVIHQFEAKNGSVWRVAGRTTEKQVSSSDAVPLKKLISLTGKMDKDGRLTWARPPGNWVVLRIGHTSTGQQNATGGAGKGLECDKFNAAAINLQFNNWFGKAFENTDAALAQKVLKIFYVDSWECGSQNWSGQFAGEFRKRRGYDLLPYLPVMAGVPIESAEVSEKVLHDVRRTIADLVNDVFYKTLAARAKEKGCVFTAESVAPIMVSDGISHYKYTDLPMGEFWLNSPTHDKPNDMLDAINGAHLYGKNIVQAEAFTSVRMNWAEHPGNLKMIGDRNFALGMNKMVMHVFTHNPWINKKPGMTLDGVGLYYQRDQTWFKQSKAWIDYLSRCQSLLQMGTPVTDIAVFSGEEIPSRSVLPDRLATTLPGLFGKEKVDEQRRRLQNKGLPLRTIPDGVTHSANMADPEKWVNPLNGYKYDSFNPDALMQMTVKNGRVVLPGGASYAVLVFPAAHPLQPDAARWSLPVARKLLQLVQDGATVLMDKNQEGKGIGLSDKDVAIQDIVSRIASANRVNNIPYAVSSLPVAKDVERLNTGGRFDWAHRRSMDTDIYFITNQEDTAQRLSLSFRISDKAAEVWDPVSGNRSVNADVSASGTRTNVSVMLQPAQSLFVIFRKKRNVDNKPLPVTAKRTIVVNNSWTVQFDTAYGGPTQPVKMNNLISWSDFGDSSIRYYSGTAIYNNEFSLDGSNSKTVKLKIDSIFNMATVRVNGVNCGTLWTRPYELDITHAVKMGNNRLEIEVSNTWRNRLIGDQLPGSKITYTTAPFRLKGKPLLPAGLTGKIYVEVE